MSKSKPTYEELEREIELLRKRENQSIEKQLQERNKRYYDLVETLDETIIMIDTKGVYQYINEVGAKRLGYKQDKVIGMSMYDVFPKEIADFQVDQIHKACKSKEILVVQSQSISNNKLEWFETRLKPIKNSQGEYDKVIGIVFNISKIKNYEKELVLAKEKAEESEKKLLYAQFISKTGDFSWDIESGDAKWSLGMYKLLKYDTNEIIDLKKVNEQIHHPDDLERVTKWLIESISSNDEFVVPNEYRLICKDGEIIYVRTNGRIEFQNGKAVKFFGACQNITEKKIAEQELIKAKEKAEESDRLKSAFLANMSHEIRTPMNSILGFSSLLKKENLTEEKKEKYLELIDSGGNRLLSLISDIVDISKIDANQLSIYYETCNVNKVIDNLYNQFIIHQTNECKIIINKGLPDAKSTISTDEKRLFQILSNLIENAIKFTKNGQIEFGYTSKEEMLEFFVKDTGIGIDKNNHLTIFDRFSQVDNDYSRSGAGTGLGLSIVRSLTELLGGKVWIESEKDKGATFYFTLPYNIADSKKD